MNLILEILVSVLLLAAGYLYACGYLRGVKRKDLHASTFKLTRARVVYLFVAVAVFAATIAVFQTVYRLPEIEQWKRLLLIAALLPIAAIDLRLQKIPNKLLLVALGARVLLAGIEFLLSVSDAVAALKSNLLGAVVLFAFFLLLLLIFKNSIGMGDVKLFAVIGLYQGFWGAMNSVFFSLLVSFVLSVFLLISRKKKRKDTISFGPSILLGTVLAIVLTGV